MPPDSGKGRAYNQAQPRAVEAATNGGFDWTIGLLVATIFILGEFAVVMIGLALLGGHLGLRPSDRRPRLAS